MAVLTTSKVPFLNYHRYKETTRYTIGLPSDKILHSLPIVSRGTLIQSGGNSANFPLLLQSYQMIIKQLFWLDVSIRPKIVFSSYNRLND